MFVFVADQVYGDEDMHSVVRQLCVDYMVFMTSCDLSILLDYSFLECFCRSLCIARKKHSKCMAGADFYR